MSRDCEIRIRGIFVGYESRCSNFPVVVIDRLIADDKTCEPPSSYSSICFPWLTARERNLDAWRGSPKQLQNPDASSDVLVASPTRV